MVMQIKLFVVGVGVDLALPGFLPSVICPFYPKKGGEGGCGPLGPFPRSATVSRT